MTSEIFRFHQEVCCTVLLREERRERERERERVWVVWHRYSLLDVWVLLLDLCTMYTTHRTETERYVFSLSRRRFRSIFKFFRIFWNFDSFTNREWELQCFRILRSVSMFNDASVRMRGWTRIWRIRRVRGLPPRSFYLLCALVYVKNVSGWVKVLI